MFATLLAWIYITFLCWSWGQFVLSRISKTKTISPDFSIVCLTGLSLIVVIISLLSLFIPLGSLFCQLIILIPAVIFFILNKCYRTLQVEIKDIFHLKLLPKIILISCVLMTLVLSSSFITYLDSIGYHAQTIKWIEDYKVIPGLVHLHRRYGYQGLWYPTYAFFNFSFLKQGFSLFLNTTMLVWFFLLIIKRINFSILNKNKSSFILWMGLLILSLLTYNMVRVTATSPSSDFIVVIFCFCIFYIFSDNSFFTANETKSFLLILFAAVAVTIKLSVLPILFFIIPGFIVLIRSKRIKLLITITGISLLLGTAFIARNIISSGYIAFPSTIVDIFHADWKYDKGLTIIEKNYISTYAKTHVAYTTKNVEAVMNMKLTEWLPKWWQVNHVYNKIILILTVIAFIILIWKIRIILTTHRRLLFPMVIAIAGIVFWFIQAPDPRFGFGFIIPFIGLSFSVTLKDNFWKDSFSKIFSPAISISLCLCILAYTGYKMIYTDKIGLMWPMGLQKVVYKTIKIKGNSFNIPDDHGPCAGTPLPCVYDSCQTFELRGEKITDGFKAKKGYKPSSWHL